MRQCSRCARFLPLAHFGVDRSKRGDVNPCCRECERERSRAYRASKLGQKTAKSRFHSEEYLLRRREWAKERRVSGNWYDERERKHAAIYRERYPEKDRAKQILNKAVVSGAIIRQTTCESCGTINPRGTDGRTLIQAHHDDYSKPLEVRWLCVQCHADTHRSRSTQGEG